MTATTAIPTSLEQMESQNLVISLADLKKDTELLEEIQTRLKGLGLYAIAVDGLWGPSTENAIDQFCEAVHLNCMDTGLFGASFAKALLETPAIDNPGPYGLPTWWQGAIKINSLKPWPKKLMPRELQIETKFVT